jgi:hypothetical protein
MECSLRCTCLIVATGNVSGSRSSHNVTVAMVNEGMLPPPIDRVCIASALFGGVGAVASPPCVTMAARAMGAGSIITEVDYTAPFVRSILFYFFV